MLTFRVVVWPLSGGSQRREPPKLKYTNQQVIQTLTMFWRLLLCVLLFYIPIDSHMTPGALAPYKILKLDSALGSMQLKLSFRYLFGAMVNGPTELPCFGFPVSAHCGC